MHADTAVPLLAFLEHPARPEGTLTYHELQGFLFAVVSAPELIRPSEWLPIIFNEHDAGYATLEEAELILGRIMGALQRDQHVCARGARRPTRRLHGALAGVGEPGNDPCPCGSGKKFKKCCGQPTR